MQVFVERAGERVLAGGVGSPTVRHEPVMKLTDRQDEPALLIVVQDFVGHLDPSFAQASAGKEKVTEGLDGLLGRLKEYFDMGARFAKWRAAFTISETTPSQDCIEENAKRLAEYAFLCQEAGIVPIVEPEVLMDGGHNIDQCREVTEKVLQTVFAELEKRGVALEGMILKPNMVISGLACLVQASVEEVADATVTLLVQLVPKNVGGVAFLSGGQSSQLASAHLNAMNLKHKSELPWPLTFSYSRAIQYPALEIWAGTAENIPAAQEALYFRAKLNQSARRGEYNSEMENKKSGE